MDQVKNFKGCLPQILLGLFLNALTQIFSSFSNLDVWIRSFISYFANYSQGSLNFFRWQTGISPCQRKLWSCWSGNSSPEWSFSESAVSALALCITLLFAIQLSLTIFVLLKVLFFLIFRLSTNVFFKISFVNPPLSIWDLLS